MNEVRPQVQDFISECNRFLEFAQEGGNLSVEEREALK